MSVTDFIATLALVVATATFTLQIKQWLDSGPRLHITVMADAVEFPQDDGRAKLAITVTNRGNEPTQITHMIAFSYKNRFARHRRQPYKTGIVNIFGLPHLLEPKRYWIGKMFYSADTTPQREAGELYVGIYATHREKEYLVKVPPRSDDLKLRTMRSPTMV